MSDRAKEVLEDPNTDALIGAGALYEIAIKSRSGRLTLPEAAETYLPGLLRRYSFGVLSIDESHALRAAALPLIHRDPWDRLLIGQAQAEMLPIVTADPVIGQYDVEVVW